MNLERLNFCGLCGNLHNNNSCIVLFYLVDRIRKFAYFPDGEIKYPRSGNVKFEEKARK